MKFTFSWLKDHLDTNLDVDGIVAIMMKAGLEVEKIDDPASELSAFTVANVIECDKHPDADRLSVCSVDTVDGIKQIVCGAPNVKKGMFGVYAPLGTYIPGLDFTLDKKPRKIRGVESQGMLCSSKEVQVGTDHDGIIELDHSLKIGTPAAKALGVDDITIAFEVTPNRPDWLGVRGIARDLAAAGAGKLKPAQINYSQGNSDCPIGVELFNPEACPVFAGALLTNVNNCASPDWMQQKLKSVGLTPRSLLVDVTNFVSLDRARPLHVYDAKLLQGTVSARLGNFGEKCKALDGKVYNVTEDMCVICDDSGVIGLGGVMGGESTAVSEETTEVFIESAWFDPYRTARTSRVTGIQSDAKMRFERGVDPNSCEDGVALAISLIQKYGGGDTTRIQVTGQPPQTNQSFEFFPKDVVRLTGLTVSTERMEELLRLLEVSYEKDYDSWKIVPPNWRFDLNQSADIVEEIARLTGYDQLPETSLPQNKANSTCVVTPLQHRSRIARRVLASRGFVEAVTWSFISKTEAELFAGGKSVDQSLQIANPVASDLDFMRSSIIGILCRAIQRAVNRGQRLVRLFETGPVYLTDLPDGQKSAVTAVCRPVVERHWQGKKHIYDTFASKADLFAVLEALGQPPSRFQIVESEAPFFHPAQAGTLKLGPKVTIAHFGAIHPRILKELDVDGTLFGFELLLDSLPKSRGKPSKTRPILNRAQLTSIQRDFAFIVNEDIKAGEIIRRVLATDKTYITDAAIFDVYRDDKIGDGKKSVAIEVTIQPKEESLRDDEIEAISQKIIQSVSKGTGGILRA